MLDEAKKREKVANAILAASMALSAAQSPEDFVRGIESPGVALMQRWGRVRREADRNLDNGRVSHPARNIKMKTFKEFVEESYLAEMRKEDEVRGKKKTPEFVDVVKTKKVAEKTPEGNWQVNKYTTRDKIRNPEAQPLGQNYKYTGGSPGDYNPNPQGTGGALRGKKKVPGAKTKPKWGTPEYRRSPAQIVADRRAASEYTGYDYKAPFKR